jgi:chromosome partitioning protein
MGKIIAVTNQKGGVGKTTTCVNLAAALAEAQRRVLLIDFDPQGHATMGAGIAKREAKPSGCEVLLEEVPIEQAIRQVDGGFDLLPANGDLTAAEVRLMPLPGREMKLKQLLAPVRGRYHYILIDCPPSLGVLTLNALTAADSVLIPIQCEFYALDGLTALLDTIKAIRASVNPALKIEGLLRTMFDVRNNLGNEVSGQLLKHFGDQVFRTIIPRNVRLAEAPSHGRPITSYDRESRGSIAYLGLAGEIIRHERAPAGAAKPGTPA